MNTSLNNPDAGKNRVNKSYNTKNNYSQNDKIPDVIMEEDEVDYNNNISVSNISNLFQSKILDMSIVNRSQQRLSPIHINNRKYPIIDYIGTNSNNNKLTDRSLVIGSPTRKNNILEKSLIQEDEDYKGPLLNVLQKASLNYSDEIPEFFENQNDKYLVPTDFYKRNPDIKLFINEKDLNNINQETIYNNLYTKTPLLEIDRFIINELNSKLEMSYNNFQKIINDYNNPDNFEKLPYLLRKFEKHEYKKMLDNDGYNLDKLIKLLNIIKDNCDLESKKIWLNWRIQQLDGICLVLRDNLKMVEEQQRELNFFKNKLDMINYELDKLKKLSTFKKNKIKAVNFENEKSTTENYENKKWEIKRTIILKKYNFDIGERKALNNEENEKALIAKLQELEKTSESDIPVRSPIVKPKEEQDGKFISIFKAYFSAYEYELVKRQAQGGAKSPNVVFEYNFKYLPYHTIQFTYNAVENKIVKIVSVKKHTTVTNADNSNLWILFKNNDKVVVQEILDRSDTTTGKVENLKDLMDLYKKLENGYKILDRLLSLKIENGSFKGNVTLNRFNGKIMFKISFNKFKMIVLDNYNLFKELSLETINEEDDEYVKINFINNDIGANGLWKDEIPTFFKDVLGWYI